MRQIAQIGAHAKGFNANSIGIAYEGGLDPDGNPADTRTAEQRTALITLLKQLHERFPEARICATCHLTSTATDASNQPSTLSNVHASMPLRNTHT